MKEYRVKVYSDRTVWYNLDGQKHREDGPAFEYINVAKFWYLNDLTHRLDGPAVEYFDGHKEWWVNGHRHREGGPAIEYANGDKQWFFHGQCLSEKEFNKKMSKNPCVRKVVAIDGKKYKLLEMND